MAFQVCDELKFYQDGFCSKMAFDLKRSAAFQEDEEAIEEEPLPAD